MASKTVHLESVLAVFRKWLYVPDFGIVEITLATVAANRIMGDPVWLLLTGPPSSGKTETLNSLLALPDMYAASTVTEAALLSGTAKRDRVPGATGGLLLRIGKFGILVSKDFTSILEMNRDKRKALLAALREVYDGAWNRHLGVDGAKELSWSGKLGLIGGVTSAIDGHHTVMSAMGQRFALYRLPIVDGHAQAKRAIETTGGEVEMRAALSSVVADFFNSINFDSPPRLGPQEHQWIIPLTNLVATCRSAVDRDAYGRGIELIHDAEAPARLTKMLAQSAGPLSDRRKTEARARIDRQGWIRLHAARKEDCS